MVHLYVNLALTMRYTKKQVKQIEDKETQNYIDNEED